MNLDLRTDIDIFHKESVRRASYQEQSTTCFNNVADITVDSDGITPQKKQSGGDEYFQEDRQIPFNKNE